MSKMTIEEFQVKAELHLKLFVDAVNSDDESENIHSEDDWWERFTEFSMELEDV